MCGFVVLRRLGDRPLPGPDCIREMAASILHRGPDGWGFYDDDEIQMAAVRLAVLDPSGGRQPLRGCTPDVIGVYNGEMYNHRELRTELASRGHAIPDGCDASLLPHLYEEHGERLVERIRGMFAFAIWDPRARRLLLARDRLGIKPLFYANTGEFLIVASEIKAIFASGLVKPAIDPESLDDLFSLGYPCPPRTMFREILELRPAHLWTEGPPRRYWRAPFPPRGNHRKGTAGELREALRDAVRTHLVADVPVASSLSGGLDSSAVAALAREVSGIAPSTFSLVFDEAPYDESFHAREVARALGAAAEEVPFRAAHAEFLPEMLWHTELPLLMPGAIGGLLLSERQRARGFRVALTGDGADELFGGYDVFRAARARRALDASPLRPLQPMLLSAAARLSGLPRGMGALLSRNAAESRRIADAFGGVVPPWVDQWQLLDVDRAALLSVGGRRVRPVLEPPAGFRNLVRDDVRELDPLDGQLAIELESRLPSWILVISDRSAMARGIEARVPFLDDRVVELAVTLHPSLKMRLLQEKAILRRAVRDLLPPSIVRRRKKPFTLPIEPWFFSADSPPFVREALSPPELEEAGLFRPPVVAKLLDQLPRCYPGDVGRFQLELVLMLVLSSQLLHRLFVQGRDRPKSPLRPPHFA